MEFSKEKNEIPDWILYHLKRFGNCCCGREIVKKIGREKIVEVLKKKGYPCVLKVVPDDIRHYKRKIKYPVDAYYILEVSVVKSYFV